MSIIFSYFDYSLNVIELVGTCCTRLYIDSGIVNRLRVEFDGMYIPILEILFSLLSDDDCLPLTKSITFFPLKYCKIKL